MEKINSNILDEIVFENRNKTYGAYYLRKKYMKVAVIALVIAVVFYLLFVSTLFIVGYFNQDHYIIMDKTVMIELSDLKPKEMFQLPPPPPLPEALGHAVKPVAPVVTTDTLVDTNHRLNVFNDNGNDDDGKGEIGTENEIYTSVEELPSFPGGKTALDRYLSFNIRYPQKAKEKEIQGTVMILFVIEKDGSVSGVKVIRNVGGGCDEEAVRVVKMMPKWKPGKQRGNPVRVYCKLPLTFVLTG